MDGNERLGGVGTTRVAFDGWPLSSAAAHRGVGTFVRNVAGGLAGNPAIDLIGLVTQPSVLPAGAGSLAIRRQAPGRWLTAEHWWRLPRDVRRVGADVFWAAGPEPPRRSPVPVVQTLYDVIPLTSGDPGLAGERRWWSRYASRYRSADAVMAISRYSADEAIRVLDLDPRRVHVSRCGVDPSYHPGGPSASSDRPYVLAVGQYSARKGWAEAFAAIGRLADAGYPHQLKVAGRIAPWVAPVVDRLRADAPRPDRVELLGHVDDLASLYRGASVFVGCSRLEGFGLPALEAMACATPVVAFANSATTEVVADAGVLVLDGDVVALADALARVFDDSSWSHELSARGVARADTFRWADTVADYAQVLTAVGDR